MKEEFNLSEKILFADSRDLVDLNSETSKNKRRFEDLWTAELITIEDVKEFIRLLKEELYPFEDEHGQEVNPIIDTLAGEKLL